MEPTPRHKKNLCRKLRDTSLGLNDRVVYDNVGTGVSAA